MSTDLEPGIYFDLPEEAYHADVAFSASGAKDMLVSPLTYWMNSALNPDREDESTAAKERGKAFHTRILEGKEVFAARYAVKPDKADYPDAICDGAGLRERCGELGLPRNGTNAELCRRIREADPDAVLWPEIIARFQEENAGKIALTYKQFFEIERQAKIIDMQDAARKAFSGGHSESSIFWIDPETGVRMKARADYIKTRAVVDLKTFTNPMGLPIDVAIARAVANYRYSVQACVYLDGIEKVKELYRQKGFACVHGNAPSKEWMDAFAASGAHAFFFVFLEAGAVPNIRVREFRMTETYAQLGATTNLYWQSGHAGYRMAVERYKECLELYGTEIPWVDAQPARAFRDDDFPTWMFD